MYSTLEQAQIQAMKNTAKEIGFTFNEAQAHTTNNTLEFAQNSFNKALEGYLSRTALDLINSEASDRIEELENQLEIQAREHTEAVTAIEAKISEMGALS
ncbi:hypothetical protein AB4383_07990 [Vibrio breoganii]